MNEMEFRCPDIRFVPIGARGLPHCFAFTTIQSHEIGAAKHDNVAHTFVRRKTVVKSVVVLENNGSGFVCSMETGLLKVSASSAIPRQAIIIINVAQIRFVMICQLFICITVLIIAIRRERLGAALN